MEILGLVGSAITLVGWIWAIVSGFQTGGTLWGVLNIIPAQPLVAIISAILKKVSWIPVLLMVIGAVLLFVGGGASAISKLLS